MQKMLVSSCESKIASILTLLPEKNKIELVIDYISQLPNADPQKIKESRWKKHWRRHMQNLTI